MRPHLRLTLLLALLLAIVPLGSFDPGLIEPVRAALREIYGIESEALPPQALPQSAYYPPRQRYRAEKLLEHLDSSVDPARYEKVLGLTTVDISTTKGEHEDWGIFGLGNLGGRSGVVSVFRLRRDRPGPEKLTERLIKVAAHEVGHTLGLEHCPSQGCLMEDAAGTIQTVDAEGKSLCPACRAKLP